MPNDLFGLELTAALAAAQESVRIGRTRTALVDGRPVSIPYPFPSPGDWRDCWIYFLLTDRFADPAAPPRFAWDQKFNFRQGGTFEGVRQQLGYLQGLPRQGTGGPG
jgi:hypothetical protein